MRHLLPPELELLDSIRRDALTHERTCQVALVDPLHTGAGFIAAARRRGLGVVAVYTLPHSMIRTLDPHFAAAADLNLHARSAADAADVLRRLPQRTLGVVPTSEPSIEVADGLAQSMSLIGNPLCTARARRNKIAMRKLARTNGIRTPRHDVVEHVEDLPAAAERIGFPAMLKPPAGAGAHGVTLLADAAAANRIIPGLDDDHDVFGRPVHRWLVEEYVRGRELAVNAITTPRGHQLIDIWEYRRPDGADYDQPYWNVVQLTRDDPVRAIAWEFVRDVLDKYRVVVGPSHTEIKLSPDGPVLIETASRLPGAHMTEVWSRHSFLRPFDDVLALFLGEDPFGTRPLAELAFDGCSALCCIGNDVGPGTLTALRGIDQVQSVPWVDSVHVAARVGQRVPATTGLDTLLASVLVHAPTADLLEQRLRLVRSTISAEVAAMTTRTGSDCRLVA